MARRIGGLQKAVRNMVRQSSGANNKKVYAFLSGSVRVGSGSGGSVEQYPDDAVTIGGDYITIGDEYILMQ